VPVGNQYFAVLVKDVAVAAPWYQMSGCKSSTPRARTSSKAERSRTESLLPRCPHATVAPAASSEDRKAKEMTTLVIGASGANCRLLVKQMLQRGEHARFIVRSMAALPEEVASHENLSIIQASVLDLTDEDMVQHVSACRAIASCLGHTLSFQGIFGSSRRLVTDATRRLCRGSLWSGSG
jgi:hypothetical protein